MWLQPSVELGYEFVRPNGNVYRLRGNLGYQYYLEGDEATVEARYIGAPAEAGSMEVAVDVGQDMLIGEVGLELLFTNAITAQFMLNYRQADDMDQVGGQVRLSMDF